MKFSEDELVIPSQFDNLLELDAECVELCF